MASRQVESRRVQIASDIRARYPKQPSGSHTVREDRSGCSHPITRSYVIGEARPGAECLITTIAIPARARAARLA